MFGAFSPVGKSIKCPGFNSYVMILDSDNRKLMRPYFPILVSIFCLDLISRYHILYNCT